MKIGEIIRMYRKEQGLTQEQIANYLGVTAPAVNKWENGNSYPDITLLAPLARVLKTDVDTLVSFHHALTEMEINQFVSEVFEEVTLSGSVSGFERAADIIRSYPNCDKLILLLAQILNMNLDSLNEADREKYQKQVTAWFEKVVSGSEKDLSHMAAVALSQNYMAQNKYEEAQRMLDQIPLLGFDKRIAQASLYSNQGKYEEAFEIHEGMLYQNVNAAIMSLMQITQLYCKQKDFAQTDLYISLAQKLSEMFQFTPYTIGFLELIPEVEQQKKAESLKILEKIAGVLDTPMIFSNKTSICKHLKFKEMSELTATKKMLKNAVERDPELDFLREEPQFQKFLKGLSDE